MAVTVTLTRRLRMLAALPILSLAAACAAPVVEVAPEPAVLPVMQWDSSPHGQEWTEATLEALNEHGTDLINLIPGDIDTWCPGYRTADAEERAAFWAGLLSALARYESTWRQDAVGGGGQWFGLVQIAPATARGYGCEARSGSALQNGVANLRCAVRIAARTVRRDGVVAANGRGFAADWGPFHHRTARESMAAWVRSQDYCELPAAEAGAREG